MPCHTTLHHMPHHTPHHITPPSPPRPSPSLLSPSSTHPIHAHTHTQEPIVPFLTDRNLAAVADLPSLGSSWEDSEYGDAEQNQWNAMLELCFHSFVAPRLIWSMASLSATCRFASDVINCPLEKPGRARVRLTLCASGHTFFRCDGTSGDTIRANHECCFQCSPGAPPGYTGLCEILWET